MSTAPAGHREQVSFCKVCRRPFKRTLRMNRYWHAEPFLKLAEKWGESVDRAKLICMGEFWGWQTVRVGDVEAVLPVKVHTSDMTVKEGLVFLQWLIPWAAEKHSVEIHTPDEWKDAA
jgi:hypothetical protein